MQSRQICAFAFSLCILWYLLRIFRTLPQNSRKEDTEEATLQTSPFRLKTSE